MHQVRHSRWSKHLQVLVTSDILAGEIVICLTILSPLRPLVVFLVPHWRRLCVMRNCSSHRLVICTNYSITVPCVGHGIFIPDTTLGSPAPFYGVGVPSLDGFASGETFPLVRASIGSVQFAPYLFHSVVSNCVLFYPYRSPSGTRP